MPASRRSLLLTESYRSRLRALVDGVERDATQSWSGMSWDDLRGSYEPIAHRVNTTIERAQTAAVRLTAAYLTAYLSSELGRRQRTVSIPSKNYVGRSFGDKPLADTLQSPLIALLKANKERQPDPMGTGLRALITAIDLNVRNASRTALLDAIEADERISGWKRAVAGTCAACEALSGTGGPQFEVHPNCECSPSPVVRDVPDRFPIPTGTSLFMAKTKPEQDAAVGVDAAEKIRNGAAELTDFVKHERLEGAVGFVVQRPAGEIEN